MKLKILLVALLLSGMFEARAQICAFTPPSPSICEESDCIITFSVRPHGDAVVLRDSRYGTQLGINFGEDSVLHLGVNGRMSFGIDGGTEATRADASGTLACRSVLPGLFVYTVNMAPGG